MNRSVKGAAKRLLFSLSVLASLGGCAVYDTGYGGYGTYAGASGYSYYNAPVYPVAPVYGYGYGSGPFYSGPAYVPAPVLQFNYRSGGGYRHHDGRGPGWRGGEHGFHDRGNWGQNRGPGNGFRGRGPGGGGHGQH
jgi:hypothetical protein